MDFFFSAEHVFFNFDNERSDYIHEKSLKSVSCIMFCRDIVVSTRKVCVLVRLVGWSGDSELGWPWHRPAHFPSVPR